MEQIPCFRVALALRASGLTIRAFAFKELSATRVLSFVAKRVLHVCALQWLHMSEVIYCILCDADTECLFVRETMQCDKLYYWWRCARCGHEFSTDFPPAA